MLTISGCRRDQPVIDHQDVYILRNKRTSLTYTASDHIPHVECTINGKKAVVAIDTAASCVFLFRDRMEKFGVNVVGTSKNEFNTAAKSLKLEIGDKFTLTFNDELSVRIEYPHILPGPSSLADGIVGASLLDALDSVINFHSKTIILGAEKNTEHQGAVDAAARRD
jgi:hypothetical protein